MYNKVDPEKFAACLRDAYIRLTDCHDNARIFSWPQVWANTACGFDRPGTLSGQAMTTAQTIVVSSYDERISVVYHDLRFAYTVVDDNERFWHHVENQRLLGAADFEKDPTVYTKQYD